MARILSGVQPTGTLHLGNYLGAIKSWVDLVKNSKQDQFFFMVANLHSITIQQDPKGLQDAIKKTIATYIACGIDPEADNVNLFIQSDIAEHVQLAWVLSCNTPMGWMDRMTQYKDKTKNNKERQYLGLYTYPTLMASDILLYDADIVPVGHDQVQHIEITRDIAIRMNKNILKQEFFTVPKYKINESSARVMSLQDGRSKMSKSDILDKSRINLTDSNDEIMKKIKKAKTDSLQEIYHDKEARSEISNLIEIFAIITNRGIKDIEEQYKNSGNGKFKQELADAIINELEPISSKINELLKDEEFLLEKAQSSRVKEVARNKINELYRLMGLS